ncbi:hypothetical protein Bca4012_043081 [Brassica carinata]
MSLSDDEDECFARFLESEVSSVDDEEKTKEPEPKRQRIEKDKTKVVVDKDVDQKENGHNKDRNGAKRIESGDFTKVPTELFRHIFKFLSSERDEKDMIELVRSCPPDFKVYYVQMQAAKRSQAPLPSEMVDDRVVLDKTVLDKVSLWKKSKGLTNKAVIGHVCLGTKCGYHQIDDVFICEETGNVHVCDENCKEVIFCPDSGCMVCTISGLCSDSLVLETDSDTDQEEAEILTEKGRFGTYLSPAVVIPSYLYM